MTAPRITPNALEIKVAEAIGPSSSTCACARVPTLTHSRRRPDRERQWYRCFIAQPAQLAARCLQPAHPGLVFSLQVAKPALHGERGRNRSTGAAEAAPFTFKDEP